MRPTSTSTRRWITTGPIPGSAAPDIVGAFRFICGAGQLSYDDPILYPGQPGKSHLHQFYGNVAANANSTYASLRAGGDSTCNWTGKGAAANRSAYWMPAMLDGKGNVVRPDYVSHLLQAAAAVRSDGEQSVRRRNTSARRSSSRTASSSSSAGIRRASTQIKTGGAWFNCQGPSAKPGHYTTLTTALANCPAGNQLGAVIEAPECWDGKNLDSPDHRSHVAYASYGTWGYLKCPSTHPYNIPTFTMGAWYTVAAGDNTALWELSSDMMAPGQPKGHTFHADFFMAWDPTVHDMWWQNCINKLLNCSGGQLGNGKELEGRGSADLQRRTSWTHPQRLVPKP